MNEQFMNLQSKLLIALFFLALLASGILVYFRTMVIHDYPIESSPLEEEIVAE